MGPPGSAAKPPLKGIVNLYEPMGIHIGLMQIPLFERFGFFPHSLGVCSQRDYYQKLNGNGKSII
jgi:hypothetical protein